MTQTDYQPASDRSRVRRMAERGNYDPATIHAIIDEATICHAGLVAKGQPIVIPMIHGRIGETIYLHGSSGSRLLRSADSARLCLTFTLMDALVYARSVFHHSMNYRSAVVFGSGRLVEERGEFLEALEAITGHIDPARWQAARGPSEKEIRSTKVIAVEIEEASAKIRTGPPVDDEEDYDLPVWAGLVPLSTVKGRPQQDPRQSTDIALPDYLQGEGTAT